MESMMLPILMFGALGLMMFFGMRKQKRQIAAQQDMQNTVKPGARVMTTSGLHGTVTAVADDTIELEIAPGVATTWIRAAIREVIVPSPEDAVVLSDSLEDSTSDGSNPTSGLSLDKPAKDVG